MKNLFKTLVKLSLFTVFILVIFSTINITKTEAAAVASDVFANNVNPLYIARGGEVTITATPVSGATSCKLYNAATPSTIIQTITQSIVANSTITFTQKVYPTVNTTYTVDCEYIAPAINGVCAAARNTCSTIGPASDIAVNDDTNYYRWRCEGTNGGLNNDTCKSDKYTVTYFEWGGSTDVTNPNSYSINQSTGLPYSICDGQSGPFTNYFNLATSSTATYPGVQVYVYGTMISNPIANTANVQAAGHFAPGQGLRWLKKNGNNTIWEVNPSTGVILNGNLSCPSVPKATTWDGDQWKISTPLGVDEPWLDATYSYIDCYGNYAGGSMTYNQTVYACTPREAESPTSSGNIQVDISLVGPCSCPSGN